MPSPLCDQKGSALVYILIAIALLAALTVTFMEPSSQQASGQNVMRTMSALKSQIDFIRTSAQECVLLHPKGDKTLPKEGHNHPYPLNPDSLHFEGASPGRAGNDLVSNLRCPGKPGNDRNHVPIFDGASGKFLPPAPDLFEDWNWYNGPDGVYFWIRTTKSDSFLQTALEKLDAQYSACEADIITVSGGNTFDMDSATPATVVCDGGTGGALCFRVWMIRKAVTAAEFQEAGCP